MYLLLTYKTLFKTNNRIALRAGNLKVHECWLCHLVSGHPCSDASVLFITNMGTVSSLTSLWKLCLHSSTQMVSGLMSSWQMIQGSSTFSWLARQKTVTIVILNPFHFTKTSSIVKQASVNVFLIFHKILVSSKSDSWTNMNAAYTHGCLWTYCVWVCDSLGSKCLPDWDCVWGGPILSWTPPSCDV